jgi:DNA replication protein DnaC
MNQTPYDYLALEKRGVYKRYWYCTIGEIEKRGIPSQNQEQWQEVKNYTDKLKTNITDGIGLILKGPVGTMKTTMAVAVLRQQIDHGGSGYFVGMASMLDNIFTMQKRNMQEWLDYEDRLRNTPLLVLDDLGAEYHQEWVLSKVDAIVSERYNRMKPIIITTNLSSEDLKGKYAERIIDRLRSASKVITFKGNSLRESPGSVK